MKVLLTVDGEPPSDQARRLLIMIGDRDKIDLTVMAVEGFDMALVEGARTEGRYSREAGHKRATEIVDRTVEECLARGFRATGHVAEGYPPFEILHEIERGWHEVTVLGTGKTSRMGQVMLGSVSTKVLHASPTSVLVVHQADEKDQGKILVGTDGSRGSEFALRAAIGLADPERVGVHVISVVRLEEATAMAADWSRDFSTEGDELMSHLRHQAESHVAHAKQLLTEAGFATDASLIEGNPAGQLLEQAEMAGFDLVAVGSRGQGALERVFLGSVSDRIVRHARASLVGRRTA